MTVELAVLDLNRRLAVLAVDDDGHPTFPHALRGALAGMLAMPAWRVVIAFDPDTRLPLRPEVAAVVDQARRWAGENECAVTVTFRGVPSQRSAAEA